MGLFRKRTVYTTPPGDVIPWRTGNGAVNFKDVIWTSLYNDGPVYPAVLGVDNTGYPLIADLVDAPHMLVAGTTGSGKSVLLNTIICGLLVRRTPARLRLVMIDPKRVELSQYKGIPHMERPPIKTAEEAVEVLEKLVAVMEKRYTQMERRGLKNVKGLELEFPRVVVVVDEFADLMLTAKKKIETPIVRLAQLGRAAGIHLIIATQSPRKDVLTGLIKANVPTRIALTTADQRESLVILDHGGAEKLQGRGQGILKMPARRGETGMWAAWLPDEDINAICDYWRRYPAPSNKVLGRG